MVSQLPSLQQRPLSQRVQDSQLPVWDTYLSNVCLSADLHLQFLHCHTRLRKKTSFKRFKLCLDFAPSLSFRTNQEFATNVSTRPLFPPFCSPLRPKPLDSEFHDDVEQCLTEFLAIRSRSFLETAFQPLFPSRISTRIGKRPPCTPIRIFFHQQS